MSNELNHAEQRTPFHQRSTDSPPARTMPRWRMCVVLALGMPLAIGAAFLAMVLTRAAVLFAGLPVVVLSLFSDNPSVSDQAQSNLREAAWWAGSAICGVVLLGGSLIVIRASGLGAATTSGRTRR